MAITSTITLTVDDPIPEWKGVDDLPEILTISGSPPAMSGASEEIIDFHCAETVARDGGVGDTNVDPEVFKYEIIENTTYDDQS
jgi:hypothetical protein